MLLSSSILQYPLISLRPQQPSISWRCSALFCRIKFCNMSVGNITYRLTLQYFKFSSSVINASPCTITSRSCVVTETTPTLVSSASVMTTPTVVFIIKPSIPTLAHAPWGEGVCVLTVSTIQLAASVRCVRRGFTGRLERVSRLKMYAHHVDVRHLGYSLESWIVSRLVINLVLY